MEMNETDMTALLNCFDFDFPITIEQRYAILKKYIVNNDGCKTFKDFCKKVSPANDYIALAWCGMYIGIEKDGHAHS